MDRLLPGADRSDRVSFVRHYAEMVLAMFAGMFVFGMAVSLFCMAIGHGTLLSDHVGVRAPIMATNMTVGMTIWMRHRRHSWATSAEMAGAMYVPLAILIVPFWAGRLSGGMLLVGMHVLMFAGMWLVMVRRPSEYLHQATSAAPAHQHEKDGSQV
jgi:flagellar biosynthetic protein FliP